MKYAAPVRREIGIRTVFNILGPLTNPARAESQVIGVPGESLGPKIAAVLHRLGTRHSLVVHSLSGMDELSLNGGSLVWEVTSGGVRPSYPVSAASFGLNGAHGHHGNLGVVQIFQPETLFNSVHVTRVDN
jgi:anthranilate phosphoribosyltransferase